MDNDEEGARLTRREENRELIAKHRATVEPRGCPTPGSCSAVAELADLKQRLLPQFAGRAERAERENADLRHDIERLTESLTAEVNKAPSATAAPPVEETAPKGSALNTLDIIANWGDEENEWDAVVKYRSVRDMAKTRVAILRSYMKQQPTGCHDAGGLPK